MHVSRSKDMNPRQTDQPLFRGDVHMHQHSTEATAERLRLNYVKFGPGGRTAWHTHSFEQGLIILEGKGIVATEEGEHVVEAGDVVIIPEMEKHWHGGTDTTSMAHISINQPGDTTALEHVDEIQTKNV